MECGVYRDLSRVGVECLWHCVIWQRVPPVIEEEGLGDELEPLLQREGVQICFGKRLHLALQVGWAAPLQPEGAGHTYPGVVVLGATSTEKSCCVVF